MSTEGTNTLTYLFNGSTIQTAPIAVTAAKQANPGGMSLSANATSNAHSLGHFTITTTCFTRITRPICPRHSGPAPTTRHEIASPILSNLFHQQLLMAKSLFQLQIPVVVYGLFTSPPSGGTNLIWIGASGVNSNWSTALNWTNPISGSNGPPQPTNSVTFDNTAAVGLPGTPNNLVDASTLISSLLYDNNAANTSPNYNITRINDGVTLTVTNGLTVGTATDAGSNIVVNAIITGANGTLVLTNGIVAVTQGSGADGPHQAVLNMSGLEI